MDSVDSIQSPQNPVAPNVIAFPVDEPRLESDGDLEQDSGSVLGSDSLNTDLGIQQIFDDYQNRRRGGHSEHSKSATSGSPKRQNQRSFSHSQGRLFPKIRAISAGADSTTSTLLLSQETQAALAVCKDWDGTSLLLVKQMMAAGETSNYLRELQANPTCKFPYVAWYEAGARDRGDAGSMFGVSNLDEYSQFVELTKWNQRIADKVAAMLGTGNKPLQVLDAHEFQAYQKNLDTKDPDTKDKDPGAGGACRRASAGRGMAKRRTGPVSLETARKSRYLHRSLKVRHLQMILLGGTLGVGLYLNSGKALSIAGGFGTLLAFFLVGLLVMATVNSFCEMVTFVSVVDGVSGLCSRFVDESFGFATGWLYFVSFSLGLAGEVVASIIILSCFPGAKIGVNAGSTAGFTTLFLGACLASNMIPVLIFGEIEYFCSFFKILITLGGIIIMIVINRGGMGEQGVIGFKYWQHGRSDFEQNIIFGLFRPSFDLSNTGSSDSPRAIGGDLGRFLALLAAINIAAYAYSGTEIVCIAACEAKDPRKALPSATKRVFWRILIFYCLALFVVSLNLYAADPRLLRYYSGMLAVAPDAVSSDRVVQTVGGSKCKYPISSYNALGSGLQSPWVVAFQSAGLCSWGVVGNICLFMFALSCGNSHLYVSSRTVFSLALQDMAPSFLKRCNRYGTPYYAVLMSIMPALLSYTCVTRQSTVVFQNLTSVISSSGVFVWFAMCISFVRFYYGLQKRPDTVGRDDQAYPYKSPLQPYLAIFGIVVSAIVLLSMGFVVFLDGYWNTMFFFASYGTLMVFAVLYMGHRAIKGSSFLHLETLDFDSGRRENDIYVWDGGREYNRRSARDVAHKLVGMIA